MSRPPPFAPRFLVAALLMLLLGVWALGLALGSEDAGLRELARNSSLLVAATLAGALPIGTVLAALVFRTDLPAAAWWRALLILPLFIPLPVFAGLWKATLGTQGLFTVLTGAAWDMGLLPAVATHAVAALPWVVLVVGLGLRSVEPELEETALLDASGLSVFRRVTLRRASGALLSAAVLVAALVLGEMAVTNLFNFRTYAEEVYVYFSTNGALSPLALAGVPGMVLLAVLLGLAFSAMLTHDPRQWETLWRGGFVFRLGRWKWPATALLVVVTSATLGVLLWILVSRVGMQSRRVNSASPPAESQAAAVSGRDYVRTWSAGAALRTFRDALSSERREEWLASLLQSGLAAALAVATALPLVWWMHMRPRAAPALGVLLGVLLAVPGPVLALGLIMLLNRPGPLGYVYDSMGGLVLGLALRVWPFVLLAVWAPIRLLPRTLLEAARLDGAGRWQLFRYVQLPLSLGPALLGLLVGIALSLGELPVSVLLQRPGSMPLSVDIFNLLHAGVYNDVAAITLLLIALVFALGAGMILVARLMRRRLMAA